MRHRHRERFDGRAVDECAQNRRPELGLGERIPRTGLPGTTGGSAALSALLDRIEALNPALVGVLPIAATLDVADATQSTAVAQQVFVLSEQAGPLLSNPLTYANCLLSVDAQDEAAQVLQGRLQKYQKRYGELLEPWSEFLDLGLGRNRRGVSRRSGRCSIGVRRAARPRAAPRIAGPGRRKSRQRARARRHPRLGSNVQSAVFDDDVRRSGRQRTEDDGHGRSGRAAAEIGRADARTTRGTASTLRGARTKNRARRRSTRSPGGGSN